MTIATRPALDRDRNFVLDAWCASYRTAHTAGLIQMPDWYRIAFEQFGKAMDRPDVHTWIAHETTDPDPVADIYGFLIADPTERVPLLYYVYVKQPFRRQGVARMLFSAAGIDPRKPFRYACRTPVISKVHMKIPCARFDPLSARFPKVKQPCQ